MKIVLLDGEKITNIGQVYDIFSKELSFPGYFGRNLDALYDCLSERSEEIGVIIVNLKLLEMALEKRIKGLLRVLNTVSGEKENFHLLIEPFQV